MALLDDFNRANGALGANWAQVKLSTAECEVLSNQVSAPAAATGYSYWTPASYPQDTEISIIKRPGTNRYGIALRMIDEGTEGVTAYVGLDLNDGRVRIVKKTGGSDVALITTSVTVNAGDKYSFRATGALLEILANDIVISSVTDATPWLRPGRIGLYAEGGTVIGDDFSDAAPPMAFPTVLSDSHGTDVQANATQISATLPDGSDVVGRTILVCVSKDGSGPVVWPPGWEIVLEGTSNGDATYQSIRKRVVDGSEGYPPTGAFIVCTGASEEWAAHGLLIEEGIEIESAVAVATSTNADPPSLSPSWGLDDNLWIVFVTFDGEPSISGPPYPNNVRQDNTVGGSNGVGHAVCTNLIAAPSSDPSAYSSSSASWRAAHLVARVAIPPRAFPTTPILDNFNRANEGPPMTGWSLNLPLGLKVDASGCIQSGSADDNDSFWSATIASVDVEAWVVIPTLPVTGGQTRVIARYDPALGNGYYVRHDIGTPDSISIRRVSANAHVVIGGPFSQDLTNGDALGIACIGTTIEAWARLAGVWTLIGTATDANHSGASPKDKLALFTWGNGGVARYDDFGGGAVVSAALLPVGSVPPQTVVRGISITALGNIFAGSRASQTVVRAIALAGKGVISAGARAAQTVVRGVTIPLGLSQIIAGRRASETVVYGVTGRVTDFVPSQFDQLYLPKYGPQAICGVATLCSEDLTYGTDDGPTHLATDPFNRTPFTQLLGVCISAPVLFCGQFLCSQGISIHSGTGMPTSESLSEAFPTSDVLALEADPAAGDTDTIRDLPDSVALELDAEAASGIPILEVALPDAQLLNLVQDVESLTGFTVFLSDTGVLTLYPGYVGEEANVWLPKECQEITLAAEGTTTITPDVELPQVIELVVKAS